MRTSAGLVGVVLAAMIAALLVGIMLGANQGESGPPVRPLVGLAFAAVYGAPALVGGVGLARHGGAAVLSAGLVAVPLAFTSFALVTLPLIVPAFLLLSAGGPTGSRWPWLQVAVTAAAVVVAWLALFIPREFVTYAAGGGSGGAQESTLPGAAVALALVTAAVVLAAVWPRCAGSAGSLP